jgi:hypothetical protein
MRIIAQAFDSKISAIGHNAGDETLAREITNDKKTGCATQPVLMMKRSVRADERESRKRS